ncbi:helix-turn-helix domain-containing protein [Pseudomonas sp. BN414]|uniref:helix-turn-helix domain-containing protein n=1 Tax=Pseudomonas sp. BN414 TaxID=2567888 RepID=UPI0024558C76|nr:helix-turn-helix domain-containing protein [Pseudomonas sp. BN414]MDH4567112.1 helix-turn-helix domain-containing protein [Pseudomonas sp. BN414]
MTSYALLETRRASTHDIPLDQRLSFWEQYNASILVGLKCSSYSNSGLVASQSNLELERLSIALVKGNEHVVERDCSMIRSIPKESVFVSLVQESHSFFYQEGGCTLLEPGELVIYRTDRPYLFGFSGNMRQYIFDIPQDLFQARCLERLDAPLKIGAETRLQRLLIRTLCDRSQGFFERPANQDAGGFEDDSFELLANIISGQTGERRVSAHSASYLLVAKRVIAEQLGDPGLSCEWVAAAVGISVRHLARLFALEGSSPGRYIGDKRMELAHRLLSSPQASGLDISEVAYRHGFSSQAHFARSFKARYGCTPSEARNAAGSQW